MMFNKRCNSMNILLIFICCLSYYTVSKDPYKKDDVARTVLMQIYGEIMILNVRNNWCAKKAIYNQYDDVLKHVI